MTGTTCKWKISDLNGDLLDVAAIDGVEDMELQVVLNSARKFTKISENLLFVPCGKNKIDGTQLAR